MFRIWHYLAVFLEREGSGARGVRGNARRYAARDEGQGRRGRGSEKANPTADAALSEKYLDADWLQVAAARQCAPPAAPAAGSRPSALLRSALLFW